MKEKMMASKFLIDGKVAHYTIRENSYKTIDDVLRERLQKGIINILIKRQYKSIKVSWIIQKDETREEFVAKAMDWIEDN